MSIKKHYLGSKPIKYLAPCRTRILLPLLTLFLFLPRIGVAQHQGKQHFDRSGKEWFADAKFGMFIHWGLYSDLAGEWQGSKNAPTI